MNFTFQDFIVHSDTSLRRVLEIFNKTGLQTLAVSDSESRLIGIVSGGDLRRIENVSDKLQIAIGLVANFTPKFIFENYDDDQIKFLNKKHSIDFVPILTSQHKISGISFRAEKYYPRCDIPVLIMAGGFGTRLAPYTDDTPKPMVCVDGIPMLQRIISRMSKQGFQDFYIAVHHFKNQIIDYFQDGKDFGVQIKYLEEATPLDTGGALSLLRKTDINYDIVVCNGDVLAAVDYRKLYRFHKQQKSSMTLFSRQLPFHVPYGVIESNNQNNITGFREKPNVYVTVNSGIYIVNSALFHDLDYATRFPITNLIKKSIDEKLKIVHQTGDVYWRDVGTPDDLLLAEQEMSMGAY